MPWQIHESALMINACLLMPGGRQMKLDRLSALDETYVVAETDEAPLHIGALALFSGRTLLNEHGHLRLTALRLHMENRLVEVPRFRRRLERNPLDGGHFFWTDDESFDIANHVHTMTLPPRGRSRRSEERRLLDFCAELVRPRLDRSKPLWEVTFVTGLRGNRVALVEKVHHALVDGVGGVGVLNVCWSTIGRRTSQIEMPRLTMLDGNPKRCIFSIWQKMQLLNGSAPSKVLLT